MSTVHRWIYFVLIVFGLSLSACAQKSPAMEKVQPSRLEPIEGSDFKRVIMTGKAAERLDIQTVLVLDQKIARQRTVGGRVVDSLEAGSAKPGTIRVLASLNESERIMVDWSKPVRVLPLEDDDEEDFDDDAPGMTAELDEGLADDDSEDDDATYLVVATGEHPMVPGQSVLVAFTLSGSDTQRSVVPYAAVLYGVHGETWVYTNPEPLVFIREPIVIDYIEGDLAVLSEGPEAGTAIVTVGAAELFGTETGVSK